MIMHKFIKYRETDKMYDLICDNYYMLSIFSRFGISLGFGDKSIKQTCKDNNVDTNTFLAIANMLFDTESFKISEDILKSVKLDAIIKFLQRSHEYFLDYKLPEIRKDLEKTINYGDNEAASAVMRYYDEYVLEVDNHMKYEEINVFPYVNNLLKGIKSKDYKIEIFKKKHDQVETKLSELKDIIIKYYPADNTNALNNVLFDIFVCADDLHSHNLIEDNLFIPAVELHEKKIKNYE